MVKCEESWRLLDWSASDPKMNLAVSEAIFRCKRANLSPNTLYLWRTSDPVILFYPRTKDENFSRLVKEQKVELLRTRSVAGDHFFCDTGNINFSVVVDKKCLKPYIEGDYRPFLSEYEFLLDGFVVAVRKLGIEAITDNQRIFTADGQEIAAMQFAWLDDILLCIGTIYVNTETAKLKSTFKREFTSLSLILKKNIRSDKLNKIIVHEFEKKLEIIFEKNGITGAEQKLATKLYDNKYSRNKWHTEGRAPLLSLTGETLVFLYVANPPTSKCRQLIERVNRAVSCAGDEIKVILWMRGLGEQRHPLEAIPPVIFRLSKANILPAVVINGEVKFALEVPSESDLKEAIQSPDNYPNILGLLYKKRA
jgi:lipoate-protein ligase A